MLVSEYLVKYLGSMGVEYVFGILGGHLVPFYDALYNSRGIKIILAKHESAAAFYGLELRTNKRRIRSLLWYQYTVYRRFIMCVVSVCIRKLGEPYLARTLSYRMMIVINLLLQKKVYGLFIKNIVIFYRLAPINSHVISIIIYNSKEK